MANENLPGGIPFFCNAAVAAPNDERAARGRPFSRDYLPVPC